jgi:hypothetical protein
MSAGYEKVFFLLRSALLFYDLKARLRSARLLASATLAGSRHIQMNPAQGKRKVDKKPPNCKPRVVIGIVDGFQMRGFILLAEEASSYCLKIDMDD